MYCAVTQRLGMNKDALVLADWFDEHLRGLKKN
jgi:hypothetical protein